jgi:hypothetical protein
MIKYNIEEYYDVFFCSSPYKNSLNSGGVKVTQGMMKWLVYLGTAQ